MRFASSREGEESTAFDIPFLAKVSGRWLIAVPAEVRELADIAPGDIVEVVVKGAYKTPTHLEDA